MENALPEVRNEQENEISQALWQATSDHCVCTRGVTEQCLCNGANWPFDSTRLSPTPCSLPHDLIPWVLLFFRATNVVIDVQRWPPALCDSHLPPATDTPPVRLQGRPRLQTPLCTWTRASRLWHSCLTQSTGSRLTGPNRISTSATF